MSGSEPPIVRIGTRGSLLARTQTGHVVAALSGLYPDILFEPTVIRTSGDRALRDVVGAFVKELQDALLAGSVDAAVHSMKDLPTDPTAGLTIAAVPEREDPSDSVLSAHGSFAGLPAGARVGTGSARRAAQLRNRRPDLQYLPLVGNIDTRLRKLQDGQYDAIVLAAAGMRRLDFRVVDGLLEGTRLLVDVQPCDEFLPAPGQGALAVECRADDDTTLALLSSLDHAPTRAAVQAERAFLAALGGGCQTPVAAYATAEEGGLRLRGMVASPDGSAVVRGERLGPTERPEDLGRALAEALIAEGAQALLEGVPA